MNSKTFSENRLDAILSGDIRAAARLISQIESRDPSAMPLLREFYRRSGKSCVVSVTGAPGVGKSTLTDRLIEHYRAAQKRVAVIAVDPSSPFTGGAVLGDRIRMSRHYEDDGVFIRSMATRGHLGGLARAAGDVVHVLDAMGWDIIIVETVGVGQGEVDVVHLADTVLLVLAPGGGDDVQAAKAGLMEIGDVFVVNKANRAGADQTVKEIEEMLELNERSPDIWRPPVLRTEALDGEGAADVLAEIAAHLSFLEAHPAQKRHRRMERARWMLEEALREEAALPLAPQAEMERVLADIVDRKADPYTVARRLLGRS